MTQERPGFIQSLILEKVNSVFEVVQILLDDKASRPLSFDVIRANLDRFGEDADTVASSVESAKRYYFANPGEIRAIGNYAMAALTDVFDGTEPTVEDMKNWPLIWEGDQEAMELDTLVSRIISDILLTLGVLSESVGDSFSTASEKIRNGKNVVATGVSVESFGPDEYHPEVNLELTDVAIEEQG